MEIQHEKIWTTFYFLFIFLVAPIVSLMKTNLYYCLPLILHLKHSGLMAHCFDVGNFVICLYVT